MLCRLFYFIHSGSYVVINDALAILVFIYTVCASEFDPGTSTVSTETQILRGLVVLDGTRARLLTIGRDPRKWIRKTIGVKVIL